MLKAHADLAISTGVSPENSFILTNGDILELDANSAEVIDRIEAGHIFVHGLGIWDERGNVISERQALQHNGIVSIAFSRDATDGSLVGKPKIVSVGFVHTEDSRVLLRETEEALRPVLEQYLKKPNEWNEIEDIVRKTVGSFLSRRTKRRPIIITTAIDV